MSTSLGQCSRCRKFLSAVDLKEGHLCPTCYYHHVPSLGNRCCHPSRYGNFCIQCYYSRLKG